jgi:toxin ParE1/3/4
MTPVWTPRALRDVVEALTRIAAEDPGAARRLNDRLLGLVETTLVAQPMMGRPRRVHGTRELVVHPSWILVYRPRGARLELLAFRHAARRWPGRFEAL